MVGAFFVAALFAVADAGDASSLRGADAALAVLRRADRGPLDELSRAIHVAEDDLRAETSHEDPQEDLWRRVKNHLGKNAEAPEIQREEPGARRITDTETREIQHEVEHMAHRVRSLKDRDAQASATLTRELDGIEEVLGQNAQDSGLREEIVTVRADLCTQQGYMSHEFHSCEVFMRKACIPSDISMVVLPPDVPEGFCLLFFKEEAAAAGEVGYSSAGEVDHSSSGPAPGPAPGPSPGPKVLFGGKVARPMKEQGLSGDTVPPHKDWDTMVTNWQNEYGPNHRSPGTICKDHCPNEWCQIHGFCGGRKPEIKTKIQTVVVVEKREGEGEAGDEEASQASAAASSAPGPPPPQRSGSVPRFGGICVSLLAALAAAVVAQA